MSKKAHSEEIKIALPEDIWSNIFFLFDDFPFERVNTVNIRVCRLRNIWSIHRFLSLSLVCKMFKKVMESESLLLKWQKIFIYNIGYERLEITRVEQLYDIHVNLLRHIVKTYSIIQHKRDYILSKYYYYYQRVYSDYMNIEFILFRAYKQGTYTDDMEKFNKEYNENVKDMKKYLKTLDTSIKKREKGCIK